MATKTATQTLCEGEAADQDDYRSSKMPSVFTETNKMQM